MSGTGKRMGRPPRPLKFVRVPHPLMARPCIEIASHAKGPEGYVKIRPRGIGGNQIGAHRLAYLSKHGEGSIPPGWEVDHICSRRSCVHRQHLRLISRSEHKRVTNHARFGPLIEEARCHWLANPCSGSELSRAFGVWPETANRWIRAWKANPET